MEPQNDDVRLIRQYLLGNLTLEEQRQLEQHLFSDDHLQSQLNRIENELTDQYVSGELTGNSRAQFERHFMRAPERRDNVVFAKALNSYISDKEESHSLPKSVRSGLKRHGPNALLRVIAMRRPLFHASLIAAAAILGILFVWLFLSRAELRRNLEQARTAQLELERREANLRLRFDEQRVESDRLARELEREKEKLTSAMRGPGVPQLPGPPRAESSLEALIFLFSGSSRGQDESATVIISPGEKNIRLALMIDGELYDRYKVAVTAVESKEEVWNKAGLKAIRTRNGLSVITTVPVMNLTMSDYRIELYGVRTGRAYERAGYYTLRIDKK